MSSDTIIISQDVIAVQSTSSNEITYYLQTITEAK